MSHKQERQFGFLFAAVFTIVAFWPLWPLHAPNVWWLGGAGAWMAFGHVLGWINSRIILGVVFFVVVTPIGLIMRLFGKDLLRMRTPKSSTYWIERDKPIDPQSLRNQF